MKNTPINVISLAKGDRFKTDLGEFHVLEEIGEGGFATVYKALLDDREIAIKLVKMWNIMPDDRDEYAFRLEQEYKISQKFNVDNVLKIFGISEYQGNPFLVLELCENGSLREKIPNSNIREGNEIAHSILNGMEALHKDGVIHRDIKPENILFGSNNTLKLVDFGISGAIRNRVTKPNIFGAVKEIFATVAYSPPEQTDPFRAFKSLAPALDIYAFGVTMYEYFTRGHLPFGSYELYQNDLGEFNKKKNQNLWNRKHLQSAIGSNYWIDIINGCLKAKPSERFNSVSEIRQLIRGLQNNGHQGESLQNTHKTSFNWVLEIMQGDEMGRKYYLNIIALNYRSNELKMGWLDLDHPLENQVGINEIYTNYISSYHATLRFSETSREWSVQDGQETFEGIWKKSKNGVIVNGTPILDEVRILKNQDIITLGFTTMKIYAI